MTTIQEVINRHGLKITSQRLAPSPKTTGDMSLVRVENRDNVAITFLFNDNYQNRSTPEEMFSCQVSDAMAFLGCSGIDEFFTEFGYEKPSDALRAYDACRDALESLSLLGIHEDEVSGIELL